jgi:outer membrane cobalamin receptor
VLEGDRLDVGSSPPVADALRFVPGLHRVRAGGPGGRASRSLRGLDPNHVVALLDGIRLDDPTDSRGGAFDPTPLALVDIAWIETVRGPRSSVHGWMPWAASSRS